MRPRIPFTVGVTVGYVLGARAGRARYDGIMRVVRNVGERPEVQETAGLLRAQLSAWATRLWRR